MNPELQSRLLKKMSEAGLEPTDKEVARFTAGKRVSFKGRFNESKRASSVIAFSETASTIRGYFHDYHPAFGEPVKFFIDLDEDDDEKKSSPEREKSAAERKAAMDAARKAAEEEVNGKRILAAQKAADIYASGQPAEIDGHPYLVRKKVHPSGLMVAPMDSTIDILHYRPKRDEERLEGDLLVVPFFNAAGDMVNVELIDEAGRKASLFGGQRSGAFWCAGSLTGAALVGLAEGMATSQTIHELMDIPVVSVGGCHNFAPILDALKGVLPSALFVVFPDSGNGEAVARSAAEKFGATVIDPPKGIKGSDFNDLMIEKGDLAVQQQIGPVLKSLYVDPDGLPGAEGFLFNPRSALVRPDLEFVLPGLVAGSIGLIVGQGSIGKSFMVQQMALALAFGEFLPWAIEGDGSLPVTIGKVGAVFGEDELRIIQSRYFDILNAFPQYKDEHYLQLMEKNLRIYGMPGEDMRIIEDHRGELSEGLFFDRLMTFCKGKRVVFADPLAKMLDGNENDNRIANRMMEKLVHIGRKTGCSIILLHHVSKGGAGDREDWTAARGAGAITAAARWQLNMRPFTEKEMEDGRLVGKNRQDYIHLAVSKVNYGPRPAPFALYKGAGGVLFPMGVVAENPSSYDAVVGGGFGANPKKASSSGKSRDPGGRSSYPSLND